VSDVDLHLEQARQLVRDARRVVVLTGAGISAESGVPTFRGPGGLWREHRFEDLATPTAFARDARLVWEWYDYRRGEVGKAAPNAGHRALVDLEGERDVTVVTQNVDRLHHLAGSRLVHELHGSLWVVRCVGCGAEREDRTSPLDPLPPRCAECDDLLRPGVVWFGEALPEAALAASFEAAATCDVLLVVGTSAVVYPAAGVAVAALQSGRPVVEVNTEETPFSERVAVSLRGKAGEVLPRLVPGA